MKNVFLDSSTVGHFVTQWFFSAASWKSVNCFASVLLLAAVRIPELPLEACKENVYFLYIFSYCLSLPTSWVEKTVLRVAALCSYGYLHGQYLDILGGVCVRARHNLVIQCAIECFGKRNLGRGERFQLTSPEYFGCRSYSADTFQGKK